MIFCFYIAEKKDINFEFLFKKLFEVKYIEIIVEAE